MLLARLIWLIENHADSLTRATVEDLQSNPRTPSFHSIAREELESRIYRLYRNLGRWIGTRDEASIEAEYVGFGRSRRADGASLSEIIYAVILYKEHLRQFIQNNSVLGSASDQPAHEELLPSCSTRSRSSTTWSATSSTPRCTTPRAATSRRRPRHTNSPRLEAHPRVLHPRAARARDAIHRRDELLAMPGSCELWPASSTTT